MTGNKGEWSELYVLFRLLAEGRLYSADADLQRIENIYMPILAIFRNETEYLHLEYRINEPFVEVYRNDELMRQIRMDILNEYAERILYGISHGTRTGAFAIDNAEEMASELETTKLKAPSTDKTDISIKICDIMTGFEAVVGYSIKSKLGNPSTLLNPSGATNFRYRVSDINDIEYVNSLPRIRDRLYEIKHYGRLRFGHATSLVFRDNLMLIDTKMEEILAYALQLYYAEGYTYLSDIAAKMEQVNLLGFTKHGIYTYKLKKLLCAIALGMTPGREWDGRDEANGGYIVVKEDGDILAYHLYNRNAFEEYLLRNTKFDTPSTSRYDFGYLYRLAEGGNCFLNLNLQIRFI